MEGTRFGGASAVHRGPWREHRAPGPPLATAQRGESPILRWEHQGEPGVGEGREAVTSNATDALTSQLGDAKPRVQ